jgi:hypothetical protein
MPAAELPVEKRIWCGTTFFNATNVGIGALFGPGLYNVIALTGAGGAQTPYLVSPSETLTIDAEVQGHAWSRHPVLHDILLLDYSFGIHRQGESTI